MAIQIRGRGFPLLAEVDSDNVVRFNLNSGTDFAITNTGILSATTFSGTTYNTTTVTATTIKATTITGTNISGSGLSGTTISGTLMVAPTLSGNDAASAAILRLVLSTRAGKTLSGYSSIGGTSSISADGYLSAAFGGNAWYIPAVSAVAWQA